MKNFIIAFLTLLVVCSLTFNWTAYKFLKMHEVTTDSILTTDTLWLDTTIVDSIPTIKYTTVIKRDTVYKKEGDTIKAVPIMVKKKCIKTH